MDKSHYAKLQFKHYVVEFLDFKINPEFNSDDDSIEIELGFNFDLEIYSENNSAQLSLGCEIFKDYIEKGLPFYMNTKLVGYFGYDFSIEEKNLAKMLKINATAILFPYLRAIVSTVTSLCSVPTLLLPTINMHKLLEEKDNREGQ